MLKHVRIFNFVSLLFPWGDGGIKFSYWMINLSHLNNKVNEIPSYLLFKNIKDIFLDVRWCIGNMHLNLITLMEIKYRSTNRKTAIATKRTVGRVTNKWKITKYFRRIKCADERYLLNIALLNRKGKCLSYSKIIKMFNNIIL